MSKKPGALEKNRFSMASCSLCKLVSDGNITVSEVHVEWILLIPGAQTVWKITGSKLQIDGSGRILAVRLQQKKIRLYLFSAYGPIGRAEQGAWNDFFTNLNIYISKKRPDTILIISSGTNSRIQDALLNVTAPVSLAFNMSMILVNAFLHPFR